ncbi:MAG: HAD family hydrolase [Thermodesulfobacteriota bacterium]
MPQKKLVIFDCDGVMFDSKNANKKFYNHILNFFGHPAMSAKELEYVHIHNVVDSIGHIFRHYPEDLDKALDYRLEVDYAPFLDYIAMEPDLPGFLEFLKAKGCDMAISTNRTTTMEKILDIFDLGSYFGKVMTAASAPRPKPWPDALFEIMDHYNRFPDDAVYIGDSIVDEEHAENAGVDLVAFKNPELKADYHVSSFTELSALSIFE